MLLLCAAGCSKQVKDADEDELTHPAMEKAKGMEQAGDVDGAGRVYTVLLEQHPDMARAHLGLALLLERPHGDYVRAIYHYQRYLELRPDTQKRKMIAGRIRAATLALVGTVFTNETAVVKRVGVLDRENSELKIRNANLETQLTRSRMVVSNLQARQVRAVKVVETTLSAKGPPIADIHAAVRTVRVQKNDTLRHIAARVYGNQGRWKDIYEANRSVLRMPEDVRVGQVLILPE
jgi:tetratricopeptide (TPR) repeat protein